MSNRNGGNAEEYSPTVKAIVSLLVAATVTIGVWGWFHSPPSPGPAPTPFPPANREWIVIRDGLVIDAPEIVAAARTGQRGKFVLARYPLAGPPTFLDVEIRDGSDDPSPVPPVPPGPGPVPLGVEAAAAKAAAVGYFRGVAENHRKLSGEKFATVSEAMSRAVELDTVARRKYSDDLKAIMRPKLGDDKFPAEGGVLFGEMAKGFAEAVR